ncbi:MAG: 50S ribosomal protein L6 [Planctomycetaceae bacterium]
MSRIGKKPIPIPEKVDVNVDGGSVSVKGPKGDLSFKFHRNMIVEVDSEKSEVRVSRPDDARSSRALHGLTRSLISNMVTGVTTPFEKKLEIVGVGYNAKLNGKKLALQVGFANTVELPVPEGVQCDLPDATHITISSPDKQACGEFAAVIRKVRPPEPYKGKGIRYSDEHVRRKAGKAFGAK